VVDPGAGASEEFLPGGPIVDFSGGPTVVKLPFTNSRLTKKHVSTKILIR